MSNPGTPIDPVAAIVQQMNAQQPAATPTDPVEALVSQLNKQPQPKPVAPPSTLTDMARSIPGGIAQGVANAAGTMGDVAQENAGLIGWGLGKAGFPNAANDVQGAYKALVRPLAPTSEDMNAVLSAPTGGYYKPQTFPGQVTQTAASFVPMAAGAEMAIPKVGSTVLGTMGRILKNTLPAAFGSEAAGAAAQGTPYEDAAKIGGAVAGGAFGPAARAGAAGAANTVLQNTGQANPEMMNLLSQAKNLGIDIRPAQISPSPAIQTMDDQLQRLPMTGYGTGTWWNPRVSTAAQHGQFTQALSRTIGENTSALTPEVMSQATNKIGGMFNSALSGTTINATPELNSSFDALENMVSDLSPAMNPSDADRLSATIARVRNLSQNGMSGEQYQAIRQKGGLLSGLTDDGSPTVSNFGQAIRSTLDDAFQAQAPADKATQISQARSLYRNLMVLQPLADKAPLGDISPPLVLGQVNKIYPDLSKAGDIGSLGRIGQAFLKAPPNSGTAERSLALKLMSNPLSGGAELLGLPLSVTAGRATAAAINRTPPNRNSLMGTLLKSTVPGAANTAQSNQ